MKPFIIILVTAIAIARPFMSPHPASLAGSYEAIAHVVVGGLLGAWLVNRERWLLATALAVSGVEIVCAVMSRL